MSVEADDAVLLPRPAAPPRLMIGSNGPRMLAAALPHVDAWNTWYEDYGNSPDGFAKLNERISGAARDAGRDPNHIERSACVLVSLDRSGGERAASAEAPPVAGSAGRIASVLHEMRDAGADETILVVDPITEASVRELGEVVGLLADRQQPARPDPEAHL